MHAGKKKLIAQIFESLNRAKEIIDFNKTKI